MSESGLRQHKQIATKIEPLVRDIFRDLPVATHTCDLLEIVRAKPVEQHDKAGPRRPQGRPVSERRTYTEEG